MNRNCATDFKQNKFFPIFSFLGMLTFNVCEEKMLRPNNTPGEILLLDWGLFVKNTISCLLISKSLQTLNRKHFADHFEELFEVTTWYMFMAPGFILEYYAELRWPLMINADETLPRKSLRRYFFFSVSVNFGLLVLCANRKFGFSFLQSNCLLFLQFLRSFRIICN